MLNGGSQSLPPVEGVGRIKAVGLKLLTPLPGPGAKPSRNLLYQRPPLRTLAIIPANPPMLYQPQFKSLCQTQELTRRRLFTSRVPFRSHPRHQRPLEPSGWATQFCFYSSLLWTCYYMHLDDYKATTKVLHMCFRSLAQFFNHSPAFYQGHKGQKEGSSPRWKKKEENDETNLLQCIIKKCNSAKKKDQKEWKAKLNHVLYSTSSTLNVYSIETIFYIFCVILTILLSAVRYFISREISSYWPRNI